MVRRVGRVGDRTEITMLSKAPRNSRSKNLWVVGVAGVRPPQVHRLIFSNRSKPVVCPPFKQSGCEYLHLLSATNPYVLDANTCTCSARPIPTFSIQSRSQ